MERKYCKRCLMYSPSDMDIAKHEIHFDEEGICNYCKLHDKFEKNFTINGSDKLQRIIEEVREDGIGKEYDCIMGISGGCDSSYCLYLLKEVYNLRVLAFYFDNTWSTTTAVENIHTMVNSLDIDYITHVADNREFNDVSKAFLEASVPDQDIATDMIFATIYLQLMEKYDINYSFEGHSYRTEGTVPFGWMYMDGKYIQSVHKKFGKINEVKTLPLMTPDFWIEQIKKRKGDRIRILYYQDYRKEDAKKFLIKNFGWKWYGGHHYENEYTKFVRVYVLPKKFGIDKRHVEFSALVRSGQMGREKAFEKLGEPLEYDEDFLGYVKKRLDYTDSEYEEMMSRPIRSYREFDNYIPTFIDKLDIFVELSEKGMLPSTFVEKLLKLKDSIEKVK